MMPGAILPVSTFARMEYIATIPYTANAEATLPTNGGLLPNDRFYSSIILEFRGRLTMPGATGPSAVQADAHAAIIERVRIEGFHRSRRQQEKFIDMRGADLELMQRIYNPGQFVKTPTSISVTASATNDIVVQIQIPFCPLRLPVSTQAQYLLDAPNYESLKMTVQFGDFKSMVVPGASDATWSAYGSGTGTPELRVYGKFAQQQARFAGFVPGRVFRYFQEITGSPMTTSANEVRLWDIPKGFDIRNFIVKTGTKATNVTSGNNSFATMTEFLTEIRVNYGIGKYIRRYLNGDAIQADIADAYNIASKITGFSPIDFAQYGAAGEILNTRPLVSGPTGNVDLYLSANVAGASNQAMVALIEEWRYRPTSSNRTA